MTILLMAIGLFLSELLKFEMTNSYEGDSVFLAEFLVIRILMTVTVVFLTEFLQNQFLLTAILTGSPIKMLKSS